MKIQFKQWLSDVSLTRYRNNDQIAVVLTLAQEDPSVRAGESFCGEPIATVTVNLSGWFYRDFEVSVKQYSELEGTLQCLVDGGLLLPAHGHLDLHGSRDGRPRSVLRPEDASCYVALCYFTDKAKAEFPEFFVADEEECDECGEMIPNDEPNSVNDWHAESCSLHPHNVVAA